MMMQPVQGADGGARLIRALLADALARGLRPHVAAIEGRRWASATFEGVHHQVTLSAPAGAALDAWLAALPEADLPVRGYVVADLAVERIETVADETEATLAVLTLADG